MRKYNFSFNLKLTVFLSLLLLFTAACSSTHNNQVEKTASDTASKKPESNQTKPIAKTMDTVKLGTIGAENDVGFYLAIGMGYFEKQNIIVELVNFKVSSEMISQLATNRIDVASGAAQPGLFNSAAKNIEMKIVGDKGTATGTGSLSLVVRKDLHDSGAVTKVADLKGRPVAVTSLTSASFLDLNTAIQQAGGTEKDVNATQLGFPDMLVAFANKSIDAAIVQDPFIQKGMKDNLIVELIPVDKINPGRTYANIFYGAEFLQKKDLANRFMIAYVQGLRSYLDAFGPKGTQADKENAIDQIVKFANLKDKNVLREMRTFGFDPNGRPNLKSIEEDQNKWIELKKVSQKVDMNNLVDMSFVENAIKVLGAR